jgi:hypothetical protein
MLTLKSRQSLIIGTNEFGKKSFVRYFELFSGHEYIMNRSPVTSNVGRNETIAQVNRSETCILHEQKLLPQRLRE